MKILFLGNHFNSIYIYRKELVTELVRQGHDVYISLPEDKRNSFFSTLGCTIVNTRLKRRGKNPFSDLFLIHSYKKIMRHIKPDLIFSFTIKPNIYGSFASNALGFKQVCNITGTGATFSKKNLLCSIVKKLYKKSISKCFKVFFQNNADLDFFVSNNIVKNNYELLPGSGCNLEEFKFSKSLRHTTIRFLFIGRIMEIKGIDEFLICAERIKSICPKSEFVVAGNFEDKKYKKKVLEFVKRGVIEYKGYISNRADLIKNVDCVVVPSRIGEGMANVVLESYAIGRPCIGSNIPGIKEIVQHKESGLLFEAGNADSLLKCFEDFLSLDCYEINKMALKGNKLVKEKFDRKIVVKKYLDIVNENL